MLGYSSVEWVENDDLFVQLLHPEDRERVLAAHHRTHTTREPLFIEYRLRTKDGRYLWVQDEARVVADGGEFVLQGYLLDITARREAEEQLRYQAFHDALTGLANRSLFTNRVEHALVLRSQQTRAEVAVLFLDLDDFKGVNDTLGHAAGDALLRGVGVRLREALSPSYTVARMGGDEFAVLIEEVAGTPTAVDAAERIVASLQTPFERRRPRGVRHRQRRDRDSAPSRTISCGRRMSRCTGRRVRARRSTCCTHRGWPRISWDASSWSPSCGAPSARTSSSSTTSRWSISRAVPSSASRRSSAGSIPRAASSLPTSSSRSRRRPGKIVELGKWVLAEACAQVARWRAETPGAAELSLNVNVSTRQVRPGVLVESVRSALVASGLPPEALTLELTESVLARRHEELRAVLAEVALLGVRLALDDFGTGYSSLSLLQDLPVHTLKVDRSFVNALDADTTRQGFVQAIVDLAQTLDVSLVAEGMETAAQTTELRRLGCQVGQGFHFSPPLGADEVGELLAAGACESLDAAVSTRDARAEAA